VHLVGFTIESSVSCVRSLPVGWGRRVKLTVSHKWCIAPRSTETSRRRSLLPKCHTASRYTVECSFLNVHKESVAFSMPVLQTRGVLHIFARTLSVRIGKDDCSGCAVRWRHGVRQRTVRLWNLCVRHIYIYIYIYIYNVFLSSLQSMFRYFSVLR
jgi:hypothetical protein